MVELAQGYRTLIDAIHFHCTRVFLSDKPIVCVCFGLPICWWYKSTHKRFTESIRKKSQAKKESTKNRVEASHQVFFFFFFLAEWTILFKSGSLHIHILFLRRLSRFYRRYDSILQSNPKLLASTRIQIKPLRYQFHSIHFFKELLLLLYRVKIGLSNWVQVRATR